MRTAIFLLTITVVTLAQDLNYASSPQSHRSLESLIEHFTEQQPEIYRKVFQHYINQVISGWKSEGKNDKAVREQVNDLLSSGSSLLTEMTKFMRDRLFEKLGKTVATQKWGC